MPHPRLAQTAALSQPQSTARELGYRMPAEWEPMRRIWLTFPHNTETWPGCLDRAQSQFEAFMHALRGHVEVATTQQHAWPTDDSWIRDYGPIFVTGPRGLALHDFHFNGWGGKYEGVRQHDDVIPQRIAAMQQRPLWIHDLVLEGGSIEVNGQGTVMTTRQCLLNQNRNPHLSQTQIIEQLHQALGTHHVIWLPGGIIGDDTDGHIDDIARFVNPSTIVAVKPADDHPDAAMLSKNWDALQQARDQSGNKLNVLALPAPQPILYDFPADRFGAGGRLPVPASHANFLIANRAVLLPVFGQASDDQAIGVMEKAMPEHTILPIRSEYLVVGLGSLHCLSQQEPVDAQPQSAM